MERSHIFRSIGADKKINRDGEMKTTSCEAIRFHYDLSNEFYRLWLDDRMIYSAALWENAETLEAAQLRKLKYHAQAVRACESSRILDIGCGWGHLLEILVRDFQVSEAVGLTLSEAQQTYFNANNIYGNAISTLESWENYYDPLPFDGIISVGAFEHFGTRAQKAAERSAIYERFFDFCRLHLKAGRYLSLQSITYGKIRRLPSFIQKEIWPESELPTLGEIIEASSRWFEVEKIYNHREDYARTIREWSGRLRSKRNEAERLVGADKVAAYIRYLQMSEAAFTNGGLLLIRMTLRKTSKI
jgi:cyclopropane-fatty-acyl-phospholipid synthase